MIRSDRRLVAHHASRWGDTERELVAALGQRRRTDASGGRYAWLAVATMPAATRVPLLSWGASGGREPPGEVLAAHLDAVAAGLAEPKGGLR